MNKQLKIFILGIIILFSHYKVNAQNYIAQADTSRANRNKTESTEAAKDKASENRMQANNGKTNQPSVKKVKSARPDMSKARGARPAYIQRQSGSGIPKGIGKPAGAGSIKPGKR